MTAQTKSPTVFSDAGTGGTLSWTTPSNAGASDNAYASVSFSGIEATSNWLFLSGFGFSIPTDATERVLTLSTERKATVALRVEDDPYILLCGTVQNDSIGSGGFFPASDAVYVHFPLDLSGYSPAQINSSGFGIAVRLEFHSDFNTTNATGYIDAIQATISYASSTAISASLGGTAGLRPLLGGVCGIRPYLDGTSGIKS